MDGPGHLFAASNGGHLLFVDYASTGRIADLTSFAALPFLESALDDVAPLVGPGRTANGVPEPTTLALVGVGFFGKRSREH